MADLGFVDHLLLNCKVAQLVWHSIFRWFGWEAEQYVRAWNMSVGFSMGRVTWRLSFSEVICYVKREVWDVLSGPLPLWRGWLRMWVFLLPLGLLASYFPWYFFGSIIRIWLEVSFSLLFKPRRLPIRWPPPLAFAISTLVVVQLEIQVL